MWHAMHEYGLALVKSVPPMVAKVLRSVSSPLSVYTAKSRCPSLRSPRGAAPVVGRRATSGFGGLGGWRRTGHHGNDAQSEGGGPTHGARVPQEHHRSNDSCAWRLRSGLSCREFGRHSGMPETSVARILLTTALVSALTAGVSWLAPREHSGALVGGVFLAATWWTVFRHNDNAVQDAGLSLGGLLEREPLNLRRLSRAALVATLWALGCAAIIFPPFWIGFVAWFKPTAQFMLLFPREGVDAVLGQLLVVALPEEAFFRGYLQTSLDKHFRHRIRVFGAEIGPALVITAALFAVGHVLTIPNPGRLAVFFPALVFGWLRARTGGIGAAVLLHALSNLLSATLSRSYGLGG